MTDDIKAKREELARKNDAANAEVRSRKVVIHDSELTALNHRVLRNPMNSVGLSFIEGNPISKVEDLPEHLVEIHLFDSDTHANAFLGGMMAIGIGNSVGYIWETGVSTTFNQVIFLAKYDLPRPDTDKVLDAIRVVHHYSPGFDLKVRQNYEDEQVAKARINGQKQRDLAAPIKQALVDAGYTPGTSSDRWMRFGEFTLEWISPEGPFELSKGARGLVSPDIDTSVEVAAVADAAGLHFDPIQQEFIVSEIDGLNGVIMYAKRMEEAQRDCIELRKNAFQQRFRDSVKFTPSRRKFLRGAHENGIRYYNNRKNDRLVAGGVDIGATEIAVLERMGWISGDRSGWEITDDGREMLGEPRFDAQAEIEPRAPA